MFNNNNIKKKLTVIIITHNRYQYLLRILNFYLKYNSFFKILILDSSSIKMTKNISNLLKQKKEDAINIIKFDSKISLIEKLMKGTINITSEYCCIAPDDDFLIPSCFKKCVNFLEKNKNFSSAHGAYFNHKFILNKSLFLYPLYDNNFISNDNNNPKNRLEKYYNNEISIYPLYAIHRTSDYKKIISKCYEAPNNILFMEYLFTSFSLIIGKMKVFRDFYCTKEINNFVWLTENKINQYYSDKNINQVSKILANYFSDLHFGSQVDHFNFFKLKFEQKKKNFLKKINRKIDKSTKDTQFNIRQLFKYLIPERLKIYIVIFMLKIKYSIKSRDYDLLEESLSSFRYSEEELNSVRKTY
jgi:glycosyltransferase domain-containing protein